MMSKRKIFALSLHNKIVTPFVRKYGRLFVPQQLPPQFPPGRRKLCYQNAALLTLDYRVAYVEGYAVKSEASSALPHAWCVDSKVRVIDPTWEIGTAYF